MRLPRVRLTVRRLMVAVVAIGVGFVPARWLWRAQGGTLPSLSRLRNGMSEAQVTAIVGPPSSEVTRPDGSSFMTITRPGSFYWIELDFDRSGRLRFFRKDCF
jgi:hypothetical protein